MWCDHSLTLNTGLDGSSVLSHAGGAAGLARSEGRGAGPDLRRRGHGDGRGQKLLTKEVINLTSRFFTTNPD